jgi:Xaa-Pro aminopeptidase
MKKENFIERRKILMDKIKDNSLVIFYAGDLIKKTADEYYTFSPNRNFYYLTGLKKDEFILMLKKSKNELKEILFIPKNDPEIEKWVGRKLSKEEVQEITGVKSVEFLENYEKSLNVYINNDFIENVYFDFERLSWEDKENLPENFSKKLIGNYPYLKIENIYNQVCEMRMIKSESEIEYIKKAIQITKLGIEKMIKNMKPGMKENEIEAYFDFVLKQKGATDHAFHTIAAAGKNATVLHYNDNNGDTKDGDLILFDLGASYEYYSSDVSRTFPVNGKFSDRQKQIYSVVLKAMKEVEVNTKPGVKLSDLQNIAKIVLAEGCKSLGLIKEDSELFKYYYHGVAHFLGLDTHDVGKRDMELKPGMVITNEPGLYIAEENIGIRIEDDLLVTENGCENLSKDIIKEIEEIEDFMKK